MSIATAYQSMCSAWVEGRLENVLQRQKELATLHGAIKAQRSALIATLCQGTGSFPEHRPIERITR